MRVALVYCSRSQGNTAQVVRALTGRYAFDAVLPVEDAFGADVDLAGFDLVVLASGIYFGYADKRVRRIARERLARGQRVFVVLTHGSNSDHYCLKWTSALEAAGLDVIGGATCQGFYNFGPFKLVGGMHPDTPTDDAIAAIVDAYGATLERCAAAQA